MLCERFQYILSLTDFNNPPNPQGKNLQTSSLDWGFGNICYRRSLLRFNLYTELSHCSTILYYNRYWWINGANNFIHIQLQG